MEFGSIMTNMQHHVTVLQLSGQAQQLKDVNGAKDERRNEQREELLNWISSDDYEEVHDTIYAKKHAGTGEWLLQMDEFRAWDNSRTSALLWCHGKRELCSAVGLRRKILSDRQQLALGSRCLRE
jgi:hypothetical protein